MLTVLVKMVVDENDYPRFKPLLLSNAATSLTEPGCDFFSVSEMTNEESHQVEFLLYEEYKDMEAFKVHLKTAHFLSFDAETAGMLVSKDVMFYDLIQK
ncbi:putative quinol monooxygenase [Candidatus Pantoea bituminis]|uniref:putative quinol monooxygenase n=1 Tax=Candidatus Pantoea bituminis TaxID=2831036 RepID=UPI001C064279|nr:antibiotic biosynthesis monooxygenase [Pantoea bituminis]